MKIGSYSRSQNTQTTRTFKGILLLETASAPLIEGLEKKIEQIAWKTSFIDGLAYNPEIERVRGITKKEWEKRYSPDILEINDLKESWEVKNFYEWIRQENIPLLFAIHFAQKAVNSAKTDLKRFLANQNILFDDGLHLILKRGEIPCTERVGNKIMEEINDGSGMDLNEIIERFSPQLYQGENQTILKNGDILHHKKSC